MGNDPFGGSLTNLGACFVLGEALGSLGNICEAASYWLVSPAIALITAHRWIKGTGRPDALTLGLILYCLGGLIYCHCGVSPAVARTTLLSLVPAKRMVLGLTVAEAMLVVRLLSQSRGMKASTDRTRAGSIIIASLWVLVLSVCSLSLHDALPTLQPFWLLVGAAVNGLLVYALAESWHPHAIVGCVAVALGAGTAWFNPLVTGGAGYLHDNSLARHVREIDRASGGRSVWAVYGSAALASLLVANGVHVVNGEQPIPQLTPGSAGSFGA